MIRLNFYLLQLATLALLACAPRAAHAAESYDNCTGFITSLPAVITTQGTWCLKKDLATAMTSGNAITIATNNVTIDCNDFKLGGLAAGVGTQTTGIFAVDRFNVTIRHCNIRGFFSGVDMHGSDPYGSASGGHVVEDSRFDSNTAYGIIVDGDGSVVRRNRISDTGGSTELLSATEGMNVSHSVDVLDNTVSGVTALAGQNGTAIGITVIWGHDNEIAGNRVRGVLKDGTGASYGIFVSSNSPGTVRTNDITGDASAGSVGVYCDGSGSGIRAKDNVINGFETGITACSNDGNVIAP
jgi:hypothetical protein